MICIQNMSKRGAFGKVLTWKATFNNRMLDLLWRGFTMTRFSMTRFTMISYHADLWDCQYWFFPRFLFIFFVFFVFLLFSILPFFHFFQLFFHFFYFFSCLFLSFFIFFFIFCDFIFCEFVNVSYSRYASLYYYQLDYLSIRLSNRLLIEEIPNTIFSAKKSVTDKHI